MKQFIVMAAVLPLLLIFVMQFSLEQKNHYALSKVQEIVYNEVREARKTGDFSDEAVDRIKTGIAEALETEYSEVLFECYMRTRPSEESREDGLEFPEEGDDSGEVLLPLSERSELAYIIRAPINKVIAGNKLLGIRDEANRTWYEIKGAIPLLLTDPYEPESEPLAEPTDPYEPTGEPEESADPYEPESEPLAEPTDPYESVSEPTEPTEPYEPVSESAADGAT